MEATRPKKKRKNKLKPTTTSSRPVRDKDEPVKEVPLTSGASVAVLTDEPIEQPREEALYETDKQEQTLKEIQPELESHPLSIETDQPKLKVDSDSSTKHGNQIETEQVQPVDSDSGTKQIPNETETMQSEGNADSDSSTKHANQILPQESAAEEVKSKPLVIKSESRPLTPVVVGAGTYQTSQQEEIAEVGGTEDLKIATTVDEVMNNIPKIKPEAHQDIISDNMQEESSNQIVASPVETQPSAPALIDLSETVQLVCTSSREGVTEERMLYPRLDSIIQEQEFSDELIPFTEEDLAILYPNRQLDTNSLFVENFLQHTHQERHRLYELLTLYLKSKQAFTSSQKQLEALQGQYRTHQTLMWKTEMRETTSMGKCSDGSKVSHSHCHKYAVYLPEHAVKVTTALKGIRELIHEELCIRSYSSQLARIHIDNFLFEVMHSYPELASFSGDAPVTSWVPSCTPGDLEPHTSALRDCISVLFMFERRPVLDKEFSKDCRQWLDLLLSALLRVATLSDHRFLLNHLLRCPPGVGKWAVKYLHIPSPLHTKQLLHTQYPQGVSTDPYSATAQNAFIYDWGVESGLYGNWGGPLVDHFVTMLATLLLPVQEREAMLSMLEIHPQNAESAAGGMGRQFSQPWTFVEDSDEEDTEETHLLLKESDFIHFFDQFSFTELFQYILTGTMGDGDYSIESVTSHSVLRLFAFTTCLIRLLGAAFSTLRLTRYKEFIKQVGRTIRQTVQYVADLWVLYKSHRLQCGDTLVSLPPVGNNGDPRYSLNRLQLEFDQFVLRATRWILSAHKLGAWQFLADMPYGSVSLKTVWKIFWNIYCKRSSDTLSLSGFHGDSEEGMAKGRGDREQSPSTVEEIREAIKDVQYKDQFVDHLMKTYTSEAVFLLTTLVNVARARPHSNEEEAEFISTIVVEIFECTQVVDYARDAYSRTGSNLLDSIAIVHPFIISSLLDRVATVVSDVGENCILLFKELPLHLWVPTSHDLHMITTWLIDSPLNSSESLLARNILSGLNWGTKSEDGSSDLVLPWSTHCFVALAIVEAHTRHLPTHPGGKDYVPTTTGIGMYASLHRFTMATEQQEYVKWSWEIILMLKLHPNQVLMRSMQTLNPEHSGATSDPSHNDLPDGTSSRVGVHDDSKPPWIHLTPGSEDLTLPDLTSSRERELADLRDSVKYEGLLASYVAMCITSIGTDTSHFINTGLPMINRLLTEGYYLPVLRILANITPRFFAHRDALVNEESFIKIIVSVCNADLVNSSLRERWTYATPSHLVTKKMAALIQTQLQGACGPTGVGGDKVLQFWIHILLACPNWYRERSILHLLDTLCMAAHSEVSWQKALQEILLKAYKSLDPIQPHKGLLLSMTSSLASMVTRQDGDSGTPSIYNAIPCSDCPWLAYNALCAEQTFEEDEGIWKNLLKQLKKDDRASIDNALKRAFSDLGSPGGFPSTHLCIYRWAEFVTALDHTHPLLPLVWQRFFMLYLQRPHLESSMPDRASQGLRFFATSRSMSVRRKMKTSLSTTCKALKDSLSKLDSDQSMDAERRELLRVFLPKSLSLFQTFRLWLEEPRLHTGELYLSGLPPQYDSQRLAEVFQADKTLPWMEFVALWEVKGQLNSLVEEWVEIATYQKTLGTKVQSPDSSPDTALARLQGRLRKKSTSVPPPLFVYINPPCVPLSRDVLLTREALLAVVKNDVQCICDQARSYCSKLSAVSSLDDKYMTGVPDLYTNEPRQFHVRVPCHSRFKRSRQCQGPATIVFRIEEMTVQPRWEQDLKVNRIEYDDLLESLSKPVSPELCRMVMKLENTVSELSKLSRQSTNSYPNVPLQSGIALFYEMLGFIGQDTRHYPPSCQVLTTCLEILGQEFVQRDPLQTSNILEQLLTQRGKSDLLAPLFQPNVCPDQFIHMYGAAAEMAVKEGPSVAFSVLTKFNITTWLEDSDPNMSDRSQLLQYISQGLCLCGPTPTRESAILVEVYRKHFIHLIEYKFPDQYNDALRMLINCTDNGSITIDIWDDLCTLIGSHDTLSGCKLGLKQIQDSIKVLSSNHIERRTTTGRTVYSLLTKGYIPVIGKFIRRLCLALIDSWVEAVAMDTVKHNEAISGCWQSLIEMFVPWIATISGAGESSVLPPCLDGEGPSMKAMMDIFVEAVTVADKSLRDPVDSESIMSHLWQYYCTSLSIQNTPHHIMAVYHASLVKLPWANFLPDLAAIDAMMKLKLVESFPRSCFVFLGRVFPQFEWKRIAAYYNDAGSHDDGSVSVHFHIMLLQLLVMMAAEDEVMNKQDNGMPEAISDAQSFHWETVDAKTYQDILNWQKKNCDPCSVLHTGSCLFLSLRLFKSAAGFPSSSGPPDYWHNDTWEKRLAYVNLVVDLIGRSTLTKDALSQNYADALTHLFQIAVDICVHEYTEETTAHIVPLMQAILNMFTCCQSSPQVVDRLMRIMFDIIEQMPNAHLLTLPSITASCRAIQSIQCMVQVIEHLIQCHFKAIPKPRKNPSLELPKDPLNMYGWKSVIQSLLIPEEVLEEFCQNGLTECSGLSLHGHLLQMLPQSTSIAQEGRMSAKIIGWCTQIKPLASLSSEAKIFLLWEKGLGLLLRQVRFGGGNYSEQVPLFVSLASSLARYGEDKASDGLLGAIGFGKKSIYTCEFRLISRALSAFIYCQMPVDGAQSTQLRVTPHAPGHIKDPKQPPTNTPTASVHVSSTKLGEQSFHSLESLITNKNYSHLREHVLYGVEYVKNAEHSIMNCVQLLVHLCTALYPDCRFLDLLRVLEV